MIYKFHSDHISLFLFQESFSFEFSSSARSVLNSIFRRLEVSSLTSGLLLPSKSFMSWVKKSAEKLYQGTKRWLVHKLQQIVGSIERHHIPFFLERCILQFSCGSLSGSLYLQPLSSRLIVGRWNPRHHSHRPLLNLYNSFAPFHRSAPKRYVFFLDVILKFIDKIPEKTRDEKYESEIQDLSQHVISALKGKNPNYVSWDVEQRDRNHHWGR